MTLSDPQLSVKRFNQSEEKSTGADWEWWVGSQNLGWFRLRIQAKRVHEKKYTQLDHRGDIEAGHEFQYQTLIADCQDNATYPFHVFFNGWPETRFAESFKSDHEDKCGKLDQKLWGCAAVSSHVVADLHLGSWRGEWPRRSDVPRYMPASLPWSRLFTPACTIVTGGTGFKLENRPPHFIFRYMHRATLAAEIASRKRLSTMSPEVQQAAQVAHDATTFIPELPDYAQETQLVRRFFGSADYFEDDEGFWPRSNEVRYRSLPDTVLVLDLESD
ncbi:hypothetical protein GS676_24670 [Rhodococcus hoagii]|nr:hypothetical protein [Prescottella equi]NKT46021.1 hypothetical protein [Prescottella equi]